MRKIALVLAAVVFTRSLCLADDNPNLNDLVEWSKGHRLYVDNSAFACDLYKQLSCQNGNLFFSPYSISTALAMTQAGARGETATQMAKALRLSLPQDQLPGVFMALQGRLNDIENEGEVKLSVANSLWPSSQYKILNSFTQLVKSDFSATVTPLDYSKTEEARGTINQWVEDKTKNKIKDIIKPGVLTPGTRLTLVNAIYFYGKWESQFQPKNTFNLPFQVIPKQPKEVNASMMSKTDKFPYVELPNLQVLELPYQGGDVSMLIALPHSDDGIKEIEAELSPQIVREWRNKLVSTKVSVNLPKFKITWAEDLNAPLEALGMTDAFDSNANFSGIDGDPHGLIIGHVLHKAFIDLKEEGTEAAAATAVMVVGAAAPTVRIPVFVANHPFLFLIQDNKTGSILFIGRVTNPGASEE